MKNEEHLYNPGAEFSGFELHGIFTSFPERLPAREKQILINSPTDGGFSLPITIDNSRSPRLDQKDNTSPIYMIQSRNSVAVQFLVIAFSRDGATRRWSF